MGESETDQRWAQEAARCDMLEDLLDRREYLAVD